MHDQWDEFLKIYVKIIIIIPDNVYENEMCTLYIFMNDNTSKKRL